MFLNPHDHGLPLDDIRIYQSLVKEQTLIITFTMDTAIDAVVIRKLRKWPMSSSYYSLFFKSN